MALAVAPATAAPAPAARSWIIDCSAQPLGDALRAVALRTGQSIVFTPNLVGARWITARRLQGSVEAMLGQLLRGTGLRYRTVGPKTFVVFASVPDRPPAPVAEVAGGEIVVTALRRPTLLSNTPMSMVVVPGEEIARSRATRLGDLAALVPGLMVTSSGPGFERLSLRGINGSGEPSVGLYYGATPVVGPSGSSSDPSLMTPSLLLVDIDRVEVLRGPQGTLYGAGSLSGTVRVLFNQPLLSAIQTNISVESSAAKGGALGYLASAMVNIPVVQDRMAIRINVYRQSDGGQIDNIALGRRNIDARSDTGARVAIRADIAAGWRLDLTGAYQRSRVADTVTEQLAAGRDRTALPVRTPLRSSFALGEATLHGTAGRIIVDANLSGWRWNPRRTYGYTYLANGVRQDPGRCGRYLGLPGSIDCSPAQIGIWSAYIDSLTPLLLDQPLAITATTAELRLSYDHGPIQWTSGMFVNRRHDSGTSAVLRAERATGLPIAAAAPVAFRRFRTSLAQIAAFADLTWRVTDRLDLNGGGRLFGYDRKASGDASIPNPLAAAPESMSPAEYRYRARGAIGRARIDYRPSRDQLLYFEHSGGFRPGGINIVPGLDRQFAVYRDDRLTSYELGSRFDLAGGAIEVSAAAYRQRWSKFQYSALVRDGNYSIITNAGDARSEGVEAALLVRPAPGYQIRIDGAYTDARLAAIRSGAVIAFSGNPGDRLPYVAPFALGATLLGTWKVGNDRKFIANLSERLVGRYHSTFQRTDPADLSIGGTARTDWRLSLEATRFTASLFVDNLFSARGRVYAASTAAVAPQVIRAPPRTLGLSLESRF